MSFAFTPDYRARVLALPDLLRRGGGAGGLTGGRRGGRVEFREHRAYVAGDDLRDLDWNVFLRFDQLVVKEHGQKDAPEVLVVLDRSASMGPFGGGKDRIAREVAGGLAYLALSAGCHVRLAVAGEGGPVFLGRFRSERRLDAVLSLLQELGDPGGPTWLAGLRHLPAPDAQGRAAFLISDCLVDPLPVAALVALGRGSATGTLLHLVAEDERHPRLRSPCTLSDPESGERLYVPDAEALLAAFQLELEAHEEALHALAQRHRLGLVRFTDGEPFERAVLGATDAGTARR